MTDEPEKPGESAVQSALQPIIPGTPYSRINREIAEADLESPAIQRILLGEIDKLQYQLKEMSDVRRDFHEKETRCCVLEEKLKSQSSAEILYSFCLTIGSVLIGLSPSIWETGFGIVLILSGVLLIGGGIASKVILK